MRSFSRLIVFGILLMTLLACSINSPIKLPTALPEGIQETLQALPSAIPEGFIETVQALPSALPEGFEQTVQAIPTPEFTLKLPNIQITTPGNGSRITSPVTVTGLGKASFEQTLVVQVLDQNGSPLSTQPVTVVGNMGDYGGFTYDAAFTVSEEQAGRVVVYDASPKDGGLVALSSVEVTLLPSGSPEIKMPTVGAVALSIAEPANGAEFSSGSFVVKGNAPAVFESTIAIALCGEGGTGAPDLVCGTVDNIIWQGSVITGAPDMGQPGAFEVEVFYPATGTPMHARIAVYYASARDGGIIELASQNIVLK